MRLLFKQRFFSWLDSYDIYHEDGSVAYTVEGKLSWGHKLVICSPDGDEIGTVREEVLTFLPRFALYLGEREIGAVRRELTLFRPSYTLDCMGWQIDGDFMQWDYTVRDAQGGLVATISKELFHWTDTYVLDVQDPSNALYVLMIALAIDAAQCSDS